MSRTLRAAMPKRGGRLRMGISGSSTSDSLDSALPFSAMAAVVAIGQCRNGLIEVDAAGNLVPELCEEWESTTNDATGWRLTIGSTSHGRQPTMTRRMPYGSTVPEPTNPAHLQTPTHARFQGLAGNSVAGYLDGGTDTCAEDHDQKNRNIPAGQTCPSQNPHFRMVASAGSRLPLEPLRWRPSPSRERSALLTGTPQSSHRARRSGPSERNSSPRRHSRMWNASCPTIFAIPEPAQSFAYDCVFTRDGTAVGLPPHIFRASPK